MTIEALSYWAAFGIPLILVGATGFLRKLVEAVDFKREHWYLGLDLTVYLLGSALINLIDLAKAGISNPKGIIFTGALIVGAVILLVLQAGIHQQLVPKVERSRLQVLVLCGFCNILGILSLAAFVELKVRGII